MKRIILSVAILFVSFFFIKSPSAYAEIAQITNTENYDYAPKIDGNYIVWIDDDNTEKDLYLYTISTGTTTKIADDADNPKIDDGKILWSSNDYDNYNGELFFYDIATGVTTQVSGNESGTSFIFSYQINDGSIAWIPYEGTQEIFLYDITTGTTTQISESEIDKLDNNFTMNSGKIVWDSWDGNSFSSYDLFMYDISTGITSQITDNNITDWDPRIDGDKIIWERYDESWPRTIYAYDIPSGTEHLVTTGFTGYNPYEIGDGYAVWQGIKAQGGDSPYEIFVTDLTNFKTIQITNNDTGDYYYKISDGNIVWSGSDGIYIYNISSKTTTRITGEEYGSGNPETSNGRVTWGGNFPAEIGNVDIFLWNGISENNPPTISELNNTTVDLDSSEIYETQGSFIDSDSTSWTLAVNYGDGAGFQSQALDGNNFSLDHHYTTPGQYTVTLIVTDDEAGSDLTTATITVTGTTSPSPTPTPTSTPTPTPTPTEPVTVTINSSGDSYVKSGQDHRNYGAGEFMRIQSSGSNRSIVKFDQGEIQSAIGSGTLISAKVQLTITDNGNNWGSSGRSVDIHRMLSSWSEGNGTENDRGTGEGTTWVCATDSNISNQSKNCSGSSEWEMGQPNNPSVHPWTDSATASQTITNNQSGNIEYDVTSDVQSFLDNSNNNYGWLIKKTNEGQNGMVSFGTRESSYTPQLVITYQP